MMKNIKQIGAVCAVVVMVLASTLAWGGALSGKKETAGSRVPPHLADLTLYPPVLQGVDIAAIPSGYYPVSLELVARHGARGLVHEAPALASYQLWSYAKKHDLLTSLGEKLGPVIIKLMEINSHLGEGDPDIKKPGYGNLSQLGKLEQLQLGERLGQRMASLWSDSLDKESLVGSDAITVQTSGVSRTVQSSDYFVKGLLSQQPHLQFNFLPPDRFLLHFKDLNKVDEAKAVTPLEKWVYQASQRYQALKHHFISPSVRGESQAVLSRLYQPYLLEKLANHELIFDGSNGGKIHTKYVIHDIESAAFDLYVLRGNAADLVLENSNDFAPFFPDQYATKFNELVDAKTFNIKGPGRAAHYGENFVMVFGLVQTLFQNVDNSLAGQGNIANLYFGHDEVQIPLTVLLGITPVSQPLQDHSAYTWQNNPFRDDKYFPMANNLQWEVYQNDNGQAIIRMLLNEEPTHFVKQCKSAEMTNHSYYYDYVALKTCYQNYFKKQFDLTMH